MRSVPAHENSTVRTELEDVLELVARAAARGVRVMVPGRVESVDKGAGTVAVSLELVRPRTDPELPADEDPVLPDVPVVFPSSSAVEVSFEIAVGDHGAVVFADFALGEWLGVGELTNPGPGEPHGLSGATFWPGLWPSQDQVSIPAEGLRAGMRGGEVLEVVPGEVRAGAGASDLAIKAGYLDNEDVFLAALSSWVATVGAAFPIQTGVFQAAITAFRASLAGFKTDVTRIK